nr:hypothetical protein [Rhizopogon roseolus]
MQGIASSLLAAFGAVKGKQWLKLYKAARGRGSLQERGLQRQRKLDELERWRLRSVLASFLMLLEISLLLFGLSLCAIMWTPSHTISSAIISTTAFGFLFSLATTIISVLFPDSPFKTAGSTLIRAICIEFYNFIEGRVQDQYSPPLYFSFLEGFGSIRTPDVDVESSSIHWLLETSTNPEDVMAAAEMVSRAEWPPNLDCFFIYARLADNFATSVITSELSMTYTKTMARLCIRLESIPFRSGELSVWRSWGGRYRFTRDAFTDGRLAYGQLTNSKITGAQETDARAALRTIIVHGDRLCLSLPDNEILIWTGDFRWRHSDGNIPSSDEYDWLIDYLEYEMADQSTSAGKTKGDARTERHAWARKLYQATDKPSRVRYAALRAALIPAKN